MRNKWGMILGGTRLSSQDPPYLLGRGDGPWEKRVSHGFLRENPMSSFYLSSEVPGVMDRIHYPISLGKFLNFPEPRCISLVGINNTCLSQQ